MLAPIFIRKIAIPILGGIRSRTKVLKELDKIEKFQWLSRKEILESQWIKTAGLVKTAYENTIYYRDLFDKVGIKPKHIQSPNDMEKIPILTKQDLNNNCEKMINQKIDGKALYKNHSGGSTGVPTVFYQDDEHWIRNTATVFKSYKWYGYKEGEKQTILWGHSLEISRMDKVWQKIKNSLLNVQFIPGLYLSEQLIHDNLKKIARFNPKLIVGYSNYLYLFADYALRHNIKNICPIAVVSSANTLLDYQRKIIEEAFGCPVFDRYGSRELGCIALECECHNGLHINAENVFVEFIDGTIEKNGQKLYKLVCTSLSNYGMPFIRYEIGDLGVPTDEQCRCGRGLPKISQVKGRIHDILVSPSGRIITGDLFNVLFIYYGETISQYQVIQKRIDYIVVKIILKPESNHSDLVKIKKLIQEIVGEDVKIEIELVSHIPPLASGKLQLSFSELPVEEIISKLVSKK